MNESMKTNNYIKIEHPFLSMFASVLFIALVSCSDWRSDPNLSNSQYSELLVWEKHNSKTVFLDDVSKVLEQ